MPLRQLPDGSWLDTMTGDLRGFDPVREAQGRAIAQRQGRWPAGNPRPPTPTQQMVVLPSTQGPQAIIDPKQNLLSPNPYELGVGADPTADPKRRILLAAAVIAGCGAFVWWKNRKKSEA